MQEFITEHLENLSVEAKNVLKEAKQLYLSYYSENDSHYIRDKLKINRNDIGWYQLRNALKQRELPPNFENFNKSYSALTNKITSHIEFYGFLE